MATMHPVRYCLNQHLLDRRSSGSGGVGINHFPDAVYLERELSA